MKKLNLVFGILMAITLTFTSCYQENDFYDDNEFGDELYDDGGYDDDDSSDNDDHHDSDSEHNHDNAAVSAIASYEVDGDFLIKKGGTNSSSSWMNDEAKHQIMWEHFIKMVDPDQRRWIVEFEIFDGKKELLGYVEPIDPNDLSRWKFALAVDVAFVDGEFDKDGEYTYTLIHEYAHVLTLNETQINTNSNGCSTYKTQEGCTYADSYLNAFQQKYWADIMEEFNEAFQNYEEEEFYNQYQDRFVTAYAATNPEEDLAEVFSTFVTLDNQPQSSKIADQKVRSLYEYPELVNLRNTMRQGASVLPRAGSWKRAKQLKLQKVGRRTIFKR